MQIEIVVFHQLPLPLLLLVTHLQLQLQAIAPPERQQLKQMGQQEPQRLQLVLKSRCLLGGSEEWINMEERIMLIMARSVQVGKDHNLCLLVGKDA
eukprot:Seg292.3 transcript_id=Seg292.3/GoldUCD/mRNA.D3Y31 product="hypothetical protein" protein_id=Seg292.3/GoldUCD/D3Y31